MPNSDGADRAESSPQYKIYECTAMAPDWDGKMRPIQLDGGEHWTEIVAQSRGKARYRYLLGLDGCWPDLKIHQIAARAPKSRNAWWRMSEGWAARLDTANAIIRVMAAHGRHFFSENSDRREPVADPFIAHFRTDKWGELWFIDRYTRKPVLVRHHGHWRYFSDGGTLRSIVQHLAAHIEQAKAVNIGYFSPGPAWICGWGYGADMVKVRDEVAALLEQPEEKHV